MLLYIVTLLHLVQEAYGSCICIRNAGGDEDTNRPVLYALEKNTTTSTREFCEEKDSLPTRGLRRVIIPTQRRHSL